MAEHGNDELLSDGDKNISVVLKEKKNIYPDHVLRRRNPLLFPKRTKDIYITNRTNFKAQLSKCEKILDSGESEIIIHGLGAAINRACNLALQLQKNHYGTLQLDVKTSTVQLTDDFEPLTDDGDYKINSRQNSSIHIRLFRIIESVK